MEDLCQPTLNGRGRPIAPIAIQATNFRLKNDMIQQVQNSCQFHGLPGDDANKHLDKFLHVTQSIKVNRDTDNALRLYLFPHSLTHRATAWFDRLPRNSINTFEQMAKIFLEKYFPPSMVTKLRIETTNFRQRLNESLFKVWERYKLSIDRCPNHNMLPVTKIDTFYNGLNLRYRDTINAAAVTVAKTQNVYAARAYNQGDVQPTVVQVETQIPNSESVVAPVVEPVVAPVSVPKRNSKPSIPYPSRLHDQKLRDKSNDQKENFFQIFQDLNFNISFADALIRMPKFGQTIKSLLTNKYKLFELSRTPLNEHYSVVLLKKLPKKMGDPDKFLILCDFSGMNECLALADLGAIINIMPLSMWNKLSLPKISPTCMTLELADRSISRELTLRVGKEAVTCNLDQTSRYSSNYDAMSVNRIDLIDIACEEYSQEVLTFSMSGNPTPSMEPIISVSSPTFTPFEDSDFLLEETDAFLLIDDESISLEIDDCYYDSDGDMLLLEEFLNDDPSAPPLPPQELKVVEPNNEKAFIDEPPVVEFKDLPPHLEYAFLEGDDKLPVMIAKDLKDEGKTTLKKEVEDDILREKLLKIHLFIAKIESLNDNPTPDRVLKYPSLFPILVEDIDSFFENSDTSLSYSNNSLPEFETFSDHKEETSSGSTTTRADYSLPKYDLFIFEIEPDHCELTSVVMKDNLGEPRVHVPNVLPTHPTLYLDLNFTPSDNSLPEFEIFCFDIEEKNSGSVSHRSGTFMKFNVYPNHLNESPMEILSSTCSPMDQ
nr:reverse transcriptase domain-containing protein [Tanacetum cinerariifolium]